MSLSASGAATGRARRRAGNALARCPRLALLLCAGALYETRRYRAWFLPIAGGCWGPMEHQFARRNWLTIILLTETGQTATRRTLGSGEKRHGRVAAAHRPLSPHPGRRRRSLLLIAIGKRIARTTQINSLLLPLGHHYRSCIPPSVPRQLRCPGSRRT